MAVTVESLALEVARAFEPLKDRLAAGEVRTLFAELGMPAPDTVLGAAGVMDAIGDTATAVGELPDKIDGPRRRHQLRGTLPRSWLALAALTPIIASVTTSVDRIADAVDGAASGSASAEIQAFATALPERLVGYLLAHYLERQHPVVAGVAELLGLLERNAAAATAAAPAYVERRLRLDLLGDLLDDPVAVLANDYHWGAADLQVGQAAGPARPVRQQRRQGRLRAARARRRPAGAADLHGRPRPHRRPSPTIPGIRASTRVDLAKKLDVADPTPSGTRAGRGAGRRPERAALRST